MRYLFDKSVTDINLTRRVETTRCRFGDILFLKPDENSYKKRLVLTGGRRALNPDIMAIRLPDLNSDDDPVRISYDKREDMLVPTDLDSLKPFEWFEINRSELRAANQRYNISEFVTAIETAMQMTEVPNAGSSKSNYYSRVGQTNDEGKDILELLEEGRYFDAAAQVRVNQKGTWDATARKYNYDTTGLKAKDVKSIRHMAYQQMGVLYLEQQPMISLPQLVNAEQKLVDFGKPITDRVL